MGLKQANKVRQIGVLPSHNADPIPVGKIPDSGTQVAVNGSAVNSTISIHTVTGGKTFYLTHYTLESNTSATEVYGRLFVRNVADVIQYIILYHFFGTVGQMSNTGQFQPPLEIPAGWDVCISTNNAACDTNGFIHGYET